MIDGKISQIPLSLAVVNPIPTARERDRRQQSDVETNYYYKEKLRNNHNIDSLWKPDGF